MDEFRKEFEYTEEKRGLILLFVIMLILVDLFQSPFYIMPLHTYFKQNSILDMCYMGVSVIFVLFILVTALSCYKVNKNLVMISKVYLIVRIIFFEFSVITLFLLDIKGENMDYMKRLVFPRLIMPVLFELVFSSLWFLYFMKSKRCREIVNSKA